MTDQANPRRRGLLKTAAVAAGAMSAPMIASAQTGPINMRWQSTWPAKDIFHEYALDFAKKVNDMTGGDLKIEVLPAGAVVPAFGLLEAVTKGTLDGGHGVLGYHYGKQNATCCCHGTTTVVVPNSWPSSTPQLAPMFNLSCMAPWPLSLWVGSRSPSPSLQTLRA
jgi:TRAP-type mannitol/chloroaromatic compound transport system substrate-binding protein